MWRPVSLVTRALFSTNFRVRISTRETIALTWVHSRSFDFPFCPIIPNLMKLLKELAEGRLELPCSQIRLQRGGPSPIDVAGPGAVELNDRGSFDYSLHISADAHNSLFFNQWRSLRPPGSLTLEEDLIALTATSYSDGEWTGRVTDPGCGGNFGGPGIASGVAYELRSNSQTGDSGSDYVVFYLPGRLSFPALNFSKVEHIRGDAVASSKISRDYSEFFVGEESFKLIHEGDHTEIQCTLEKGGIAKNRHLRMQEALTYSLSQFIWPAAIEASSGGRTQVVLKACDTKSEKPDGNGAPLGWGGSLPVSDVYEIAKAFYLKLLAVEQEDPPLASKAIFSLVQATSGLIEYQILGLSIATESLIRATFPELGSVKDEFREDVQEFLKVLPAMGLSENLTRRLDGAAKGMLNPDNASAIRAFVQNYGLDLDVLKAWQDLRRSSAHGGPIPYEKLDEIWEKRSKVLSLCHAIVLAFICYSGKRTNYHQRGYPHGEWTTS